MNSRATALESGPLSSKTRGKSVGTPAKIAAPALPPVSALLLKWFTRYSRRYVRKHFHSVRFSVAGMPAAWPRLPIVLYSNHASWWDPLVFLLIKAELFADRAAFAPIDADMLQRYRIFRKMGFFGVERQTQTGARQFLRTATAILQSPQNLLVMTPHGRFADVRERPAQFETGIGHLAARIDDALFVPVAVEYIYWEERLPEILVRFGAPVDMRRDYHLATNANEWTRLFEQRLSDVQDSLAIESQRRNPANFRVILHGGAGQGGIYDWWCSLNARLRGHSFSREHGSK